MSCKKASNQKITPETSKNQKFKTLKSHVRRPQMKKNRLQLKFKNIKKFLLKTLQKVNKSPKHT